MQQWRFPLDPECPEAIKIEEYLKIALKDPQTEYYGCSDVAFALTKSEVNRHLRECKRCQEYGAANIEVE